MKFTFSINISRKTPLKTHFRFRNKKQISLLRRIMRYFRANQRREIIRGGEHDQLVLAN